MSARNGSAKGVASNATSSATSSASADEYPYTQEDLALAAEVSKRSVTNYAPVFEGLFQELGLLASVKAPAGHPSAGRFSEMGREEFAAMMGRLAPYVKAGGVTPKGRPVMKANPDQMSAEQYLALLRRRFATVVPKTSDVERVEVEVLDPGSAIEIAQDQHEALDVVRANGDNDWSAQRSKMMQSLRTIKGQGKTGLRPGQAIGRAIADQMRTDALGEIQAALGEIQQLAVELGTVEEEEES